MANLAAMDISQEEYEKICALRRRNEDGGLDDDQFEAEIRLVLIPRHNNAEYKAWWIRTVARDLVFEPGAKLANSTTSGIAMPTDARAPKW